LTTTSLAERGADVRGMFDRIATRYDAANRVMSAGVDILWRRRAITRLLAGMGERPRLLDLGAGTLDGSVAIARRAPGARVAAADFSRQMLMAGGHKLGHGDLGTRIKRHAADGQSLPYKDAAFDGAFSAFCVRNIADLGRGMSELRRVVRPGGRVVILEFFRPSKTRWFFDSFYNARVLPVIGRLVTGDDAAYKYLPASIAAFRSGAEFAELLRGVGFAQVSVRPLFPAGVAALVEAS